MVVLAILALGLKKPLDNTFTVPGTNSQDALNLLNKEFPGTGGAQATVVFSVSAPKTLSASSERQGVQATLTRLRHAPQVVFVSDPYTTGTVSKDGRIAYATVAYPVAAAKLSATAKNALLNSGAPAQAVGVSVHYGGEVAQASTQSNSEIVGIVVAFLVLLLGFGSILAALLPLLAAILGVVVTELILMTLTSVATESSTTSILAVMLGLAVGIDYSLFIMNRHRQGMVAGQEIDEAAARAVATSGGAVCFAGATVLIALLALSVVNIPFLTTMGWAAAIGVAVAVVISVTLVPALLGFSGKRLISTRWARRKLDAAAAPGFRPLSRRYVSAITGRMPAAVAVVVAGVAILIIAGIPGLHLRLGLPDAGSQPTNQTTRQAYDLISKGFGPGANGPLAVVTYAPHGITEKQTAEAASFYAQAFAEFPDIAEITPPDVNPAKNLVLLTVIPKTGPNDPRTANLITLIRHVTEGSQQRFGLQTYVTGQTALNVDVSAKLSSALPLYLGVVVILCLLILLMVFRSFLVPLTAVVGYVLSILATLGVLTFVFQEGHLANLFGVSRTGPILSFLPVLMIGILFGLAMDYEVFLVSRMREEFVNHGDPQAAVVEGFSDSAKVVASAGIIMIAVFAAFIFSDDPTTKSLGFALALGVLLDAFVVRMTLVPASMRLFGRAVWWLPRPLERRLPDLDIEGSKLETAPTPSPSESPLAKVP